MTTTSAQEYLKALAEELEISETRYDQAYDRYHSLGRWLNRDASTIKQFDPAVYVQGSFAFGTVIKPYTDTEEYDVDLVCELKKLSKTQLSQQQLKQLLGVEIDAYRRSNNMQKPMDEGRRCWTLNYSDGAQFHMDIVPALPNGVGVRRLLEQSHLDASWADTAIGITDNDVSNYNYTRITDDWPKSNPKGYLGWFKSRMKILLERRKAELAKVVHASVEDIPDYRVMTPLQSAIMILKRHRDTMFADDKTNRKPISIIITTLAGHSYQGEEQIADALYSILSNMDRFVYWDGQKYTIPNPSDTSENFADKWEKFPERQKAFFDWMNQARQDFQVVADQYSRKVIAESLSPRIGRDLAKRAEDRSGAGRPESLLKGASAASAISASKPSFGSEPRIPTKPKGFA